MKMFLTNKKFIIRMRFRQIKLFIINIVFISVEISEIYQVVNSDISLVKIISITITIK